MSALSLTPVYLSLGWGPGETHSVVNVEHQYTLTVFKNPKGWVIASPMCAIPDKL